MATHGLLTGEENLWQTTIADYFVVDVPVHNPVKERELGREFVNNPKSTTEVIQVYPRDKKTGKLVEYYSAEAPKEGHEFVISDVNHALVFNAIKAYNESVGHISNKLMTYRFEVINLKGHKETPQEFISKRSNYVSKSMGLAVATDFYKNRGNGLDRNSASKYLMISQDAETFVKTVFGKSEYSDASISFVLAVQGIWGNNEKKLFKCGKLSGYNITYGSDLTIIMDFLVKLRNQSRGRLDLTEGKCTEFAKYYHDQVRSNGKAVECDRLINYLVSHPDKAYGKPCKKCGDLIRGYFDRINEIGKRESHEDWTNLYKEIASEPGF